MMIKITNHWLNSVRSSKGGLNKAQFEKLGFSWPPPKGWAKQLVGTEISYETLQYVESKKGGVKTPLEKCLSLVKKLNKEDLATLKSELNKSCIN